MLAGSVLKGTLSFLSKSRNDVIKINFVAIKLPANIQTQDLSARK